MADPALIRLRHLPAWLFSLERLLQAVCVRAFELGPAGDTFVPLLLLRAGLGRGLLKQLTSSHAIHVEAACDGRLGLVLAGWLVMVLLGQVLS